MRELLFRSSSESETFRLGQVLGRALTSGVTVLLSGGLGAGKTVLVRGVGDSLGAVNVRSPSFTLVNEYTTSNFILVHADLYRLDPGHDDVENSLGLDDYMTEGCVLFVEWPERWLRPPRSDVLTIVIQALGETERLFQVSAAGRLASAGEDKAERVLRKLREGLW